MLFMRLALMVAAQPTRKYSEDSPSVSLVWHSIYATDVDGISSFDAEILNSFSQYLTGLALEF